MNVTVSLAPLCNSPKPPRRHTPVFCRRKRTSNTKRSTAAAASAGISIVKDGRLVKVSAAGPIERVEIVTASGAVVAQLSSPTGSLTIDTAGLADGVYVVRAVSDKQTTVSKFIL